MTPHEIAWQQGERFLRPRSEQHPPSIDWISETIQRTVKISMVWEQGPQIQARLRPLPIIHWPTPDLTALRPRLRSPQPEATSLEEKLLSVLLNGNFRRGPLSNLIPHLEVFRTHIREHIQQQTPIKIILPTLPFKSQNPLIFRRPMSAIDLGERLHFCQLRDLCASIEAIYPPGIHVTLLTDGVVYANIFGTGSTTEARLHRQRVAELRDRMDLVDNVDVIDMSWLVDQEARFGLMRQQIQNLLASKDNPVIRHYMHALKQSMLLNIPLPDISFDAFAEVVNHASTGLPPDIEQLAHETALHYASFLLTMKWLEITQRAFPDAIRGTVHPKSEPQLPLHLVNNHSVCFPHNGIPLVSKRALETTNDLRSATRLVRFSDALTETDLTEVQTEDGSFLCLLTT